MIELNKLFQIKYGTSFELNKLKIQDNGINFVSRTSKNNGVSAVVEPIKNKEPIPAGTISVSLGGSVLEAFIQLKPYYTGRDVAYLIPLVNMSEGEKLYYCNCIRSNKHKYNHGRQANRSLGELLVPQIDEIPKFVKQLEIEKLNEFSKPKAKDTTNITTAKWNEYKISDLFKLERGQGPSISTSKKEKGLVPLISTTALNNGISAFIDYEPTFTRPIISVATNGSVGETFFQENPCCLSTDVVALLPKFELNVYIAFFLIAIIRKTGENYNYGFKWGMKKISNSVIKLPSIQRKDGSYEPDWDYMENYIKSLPYSSAI